jgi:hypothetical protein
MNTFKTFGIALVVCFSLVLNGLACVLDCDVDPAAAAHSRRGCRGGRCG